MKTKLTKKQRTNFARRFSLDDWNRLCMSDDFVNAFDSGSLEECEVIAHRILNP